MRRNLLYVYTLTVLIAAGCSKSKTPGPTDTGSKNPPKLQIVSGNNQSAKVGFYPADTIKVKASGDGFDYTKYYIEFRGSGCNADLPADRSIQADGTSVAYYRLAGNVGAQTLQATLIESSSHNRIDSIAFNFTGTEVTAGLNYSACTPPLLGTDKFCKTGTGRLFVAFGEKAALRYSDDDGVSWYPVTSLGASHLFMSVRSDGKNQVIAYDYNDGIYYSPDNGETWVLRAAVPFKGLEYGSMTYASSGKMFYAPKFNTAFYSADKGVTWTKMNLPNESSYITPQEGPSGEFYILNEALGLYKSIDNGMNWTLLPGVLKSDGTHDGSFGFYVDDKTGYVYKSAQQPAAEFWISKDGGNTYQTYLTSITTLANYINKFNDVLYFQSAGSIYKIDGANHAVKLATDVFSDLDGSFIISNNNSLLYSSSIFISIIK